MHSLDTYKFNFFKYYRELHDNCGHLVVKTEVNVCIVATSRQHQTSHACEHHREHYKVPAVLSNPPYSTDLVQSDFHQCYPLKQYFAGDKI